MKKAGLITLLCLLLGFLTIRSFEFNDEYIDRLISLKLKERNLREKIINHEIKKIIQHRTVMITNSEGMGTGVVVSPSGYIITANHITGKRCDPETKITFYDGTEVTARDITLVDSEEKADFALLKINRPTIDFAPILSARDMRLLESGEKMWLCGNSHTLSALLVSECTFLTTANRTIPPTPPEQLQLFFDNFNGPGGSGGGVYSKTGGLIGMYLGTVYSPGFTSVGRALHADAIRYLLEKNHVVFQTLADYSNL